MGCKGTKKLAIVQHYCMFFHKNTTFLDKNHGVVETCPAIIINRKRRTMSARRFVSFVHPQGLEPWTP